MKYSSKKMFETLKEFFDDNNLHTDAEDLEGAECNILDAIYSHGGLSHGGLDTAIFNGKNSLRLYLAKRAIGDMECLIEYIEDDIATLEEYCEKLRDKGAEDPTFEEQTA